MKPSNYRLHKKWVFWVVFHKSWGKGNKRRTFASILQISAIAVLRTISQYISWFLRIKSIVLSYVQHYYFKHSPTKAFPSSLKSTLKSHWFPSSPTWPSPVLRTLKLGYVSINWGYFIHTNLNTFLITSESSYYEISNHMWCFVVHKKTNNILNVDIFLIHWNQQSCLQDRHCLV